MKGKVLFSGVIAIFLALTCGLVFAGGAREGTTAKKAYTVAFANVWEGNTWGVQSKAEFYAEVDRQKAAGRVGQVYYSNPNFNADKQVSDLEDLYTKNIDILIIQAVNPPAVSSIIEKFAAKGTIIIPCVSPLATDKYAATLLQDDKEFGAIGAQFLADKLGGKGNIIVLDGMDGITVAVGRWAGAKEVFDKYPGIKVLGKTFADWDYAKGKTASENFLAAFPQIDGVWASGGDMTRGAIEAFVEAKRPLVPMFGEDSNGFLKLWKKYKGQGKFDAIGSSLPTYFFAEGLKLGLDIADGKVKVGKDIPKDQVFHTQKITEQVMMKIVRPDLPDSFWSNTHMDDEHIKKLFPGG